MVNLGDRVMDVINGFKGIVIGRADYLYGCRTVLVAGEALDDKGKRPDAEWIDEDRVVVVGPGAATQPASATVRGGGPLTNPAPPLR